MRTVNSLTKYAMCIVWFVAVTTVCVTRWQGLCQLAILNPLRFRYYVHSVNILQAHANINWALMNVGGE